MKLVIMWGQVVDWVEKPSAGDYSFTAVYHHEQGHAFNIPHSGQAYNNYEFPYEDGSLRVQAEALISIRANSYPTQCLRELLTIIGALMVNGSRMNRAVVSPVTQCGGGDTQRIMCSRSLATST